ncbi:MAG: Do family serine endopeptidase [Hyphomicrobiaceae bacterium]
MTDRLTTDSSGRLMKGARMGLVAGALLGAGVVGFASTGLFDPALAQRTDASSVMTPMGRAPLSFADIAEKVKPAVVSISVSSNGNQTSMLERRGNNGTNPKPFPGLPDEFNEFFRNLPREFGNRVPQAPRRTQALGSGFFVSADGYVVTNNHVIDKADKIQIAVEIDGKMERFDAKKVGTDPRTDLALVKVDAKGKTFPFVRFAQKPSRVGDWVLAVGNPFGLGGTVTAGIVSALARGGINEGPYDFVQIDAAVNRGNSGGPTFNLDGEVIGVNTAIYSPSGGNVGIAFAVPAATATKVIEQLKTKGTVARGWLGVKIQNLDDAMAQSFGLKSTDGALIQELVSDGPAKKSGLEVQDVILEVNGAKIKDTKDLALRIAEFAPDTTVNIRVLRKDRDQVVKVKLGLFPSSTEVASGLVPQGPAKSELSSLGLTFTTPTGPNAKTGGLEVTAIENDSDAAKKGISVGDIVTHVNGEAVKSPSDVEAIIKRTKRPSVRLTVKSQNRTAVIAVNIKKG